MHVSVMLTDLNIHRNKVWLLSLATSPTPWHANLNIMLALIQYHLVQRGILTQAQRQIDFPHGYGSL